MTGRRYTNLVRTYGVIDPATDLSSIALVMVPDGGGFDVLVANGRDGVLRRDPAGRWHRLGPTPDSRAGYQAKPAVVSERYTDGNPLRVALLITALAMAAGLLTALLITGTWSPWGYGLTMSPAGAFLSLMGSVAGSPALAGTAVVLAATGIAAALALSGQLVLRRAWNPWLAWAPPLAAAAGGVTGAVIATSAGRSRGPTAAARPNSSTS